MNTSRRMFLAGLGSTGAVGLSALWTPPTFAQAAPGTDIITTHLGGELRRLLARQAAAMPARSPRDGMISDLNEAANNTRLLAMHDLFPAAQPDIAQMDGGVVDAFQNWDLLRSGMQQGIGYTGSPQALQQYVYDSRATAPQDWYSAVISSSQLNAAATMQSSATLTNQLADSIGAGQDVIGRNGYGCAWLTGFQWFFSFVGLALMFAGAVASGGAGAIVLAGMTVGMGMYFRGLSQLSGC